MDTICRERTVDAGGRLLCGRITRGDATVTAALCLSCPARACGCTNLRYTLRKFEPSRIVVRFASGRHEVWNDDPPAMRFVHAGCTARAMEIHGPEQCAACDRAALAQSAASGGRRARIIAFPDLARKVAG